MAGPRAFDTAQKRRRAKKKKSRTEVSSSESSSESESDVQSPKKAKVDVRESEGEREDVQTTLKTQLPKKQKKLSAAKPASHADEMTVNPSLSDPESESESESSEAAKPAAKNPQEDDFTSIYMRRLAAEMGDDLDKVREASDFTARSLPMLIHALRQGESAFSAEERGRVVVGARS